MKWKWLKRYEIVKKNIFYGFVDISLEEKKLSNGWSVVQVVQLTCPPVSANVVLKSLV